MKHRALPFRSAFALVRGLTLGPGARPAKIRLYLNCVCLYRTRATKTLFEDNCHGLFSTLKAYLRDGLRGVQGAECTDTLKQIAGILDLSATEVQPHQLARQVELALIDGKHACRGKEASLESWLLSISKKVESRKRDRTEAAAAGGGSGGVDADKVRRTGASAVRSRFDVHHLGDWDVVRGSKNYQDQVENLVTIHSNSKIVYDEVALLELFMTGTTPPELVEPQRGGEDDAAFEAREAALQSREASRKPIAVFHMIQAKCVELSIEPKLPFMQAVLTDRNMARLLARVWLRESWPVDADHPLPSCFLHLEFTALAEQFKGKDWSLIDFVNSAWAVVMKAYHSREVAKVGNPYADPYRLEMICKNVRNVLKIMGFVKVGRHDWFSVVHAARHAVRLYVNSSVDVTNKFNEQLQNFIQNTLKEAGELRWGILHSPTPLVELLGAVSSLNSSALRILQEFLQHADRHACEVRASRAMSVISGPNGQTVIEVPSLARPTTFSASASSLLKQAGGDLANLAKPSAGMFAPADRFTACVSIGGSDYRLDMLQAEAVALAEKAGKSLPRSVCFHYLVSHKCEQEGHTNCAKSHHGMKLAAAVAGKAKLA